MQLKMITAIMVTGIAITMIMPAVSKSESISANDDTPFPQTVERIAEKHFKQPPNIAGTFYRKSGKSGKPEWKHRPVNPNMTMEELMGAINKEYGIREDIFRYIEKTIPPGNIAARKAAIKYAQRSQFIYYKATQKEALEAASKSSLSLDCLRYAIKDDHPTLVTTKIAEMMRNTPERDMHMWDIDETYFGWKVIELESIPEDKLKETCETGDY